MTTKNILLVGRGTIAVNCLKILKRNNALPKIIICDSQDNGVDTWNKSLYKHAKKLGYKEGANLFRQTKVNDPLFIKRLKKKKQPIDIIFSVQPKAIFKKDFIELASEHIFNLHFAPLPKLRGVHTCSWAILDELKTMGVTFHLIVQKGIDDGNIVYQSLFPISGKDTVWTIYQKCVQKGTVLFTKKLPYFLSGNFKTIKQIEKNVTYHSLTEFSYDTLEVPHRQSLGKTDRFIRARIFPPLQRPFFYFDKKKVYINEVVAKTRKKPQKSLYKRKNLYYYPCLNGTLTLRGSRK